MFVAKVKWSIADPIWRKMQELGSFITLPFNVMKCPILQGFGGVAPNAVLQFLPFNSFCNIRQFASAKNMLQKKASITMAKIVIECL